MIRRRTKIEKVESPPDPMVYYSQEYVGNLTESYQQRVEAADKLLRAVENFDDSVHKKWCDAYARAKALCDCGLYELQQAAIEYKTHTKTPKTEET